MVILRPMLLVFNIAQIRVIFEVLLFILIFALVYFLCKKKNILIGIFSFLAFYAVDITLFSKNIQGVLIMLLAVVASIYIINKKKDKNLSLAFFIVGALTSYFDLLTTPLITFLLPAIVHFSINNENLKNNFCKFIKIGIFWIIGYFGFWFAKWFINDCIYNSGLIGTALNQILFRINSEEVVGSENLPIKALEYNLVYIKSWISISIIVISVFNIVKNFKTCFRKEKIIYVIIGIAPILWYLVIANHSCQHYFFTYKLLLATLLAIIFISFDNEVNVKKSREKIIVVCIIAYFLLGFLYNKYLAHFNFNKFCIQIYVKLNGIVENLQTKSIMNKKL